MSVKLLETWNLIVDLFNSNKLEENDDNYSKYIKTAKNDLKLACLISMSYLGKFQYHENLMITSPLFIDEFANSSINKQNMMINDFAKISNSEELTFLRNVNKINEIKLDDSKDEIKKLYDEYKQLQRELFRTQGKIQPESERIIERDSEYMNLVQFPNGQDLKQKFIELTLNLEPMLFDIITCFDKMGIPNDDSNTSIIEHFTGFIYRSVHNIIDLKINSILKNHNKDRLLELQKAAINYAPIEDCSLFIHNSNILTSLDKKIKELKSTNEIDSGDNSVDLKLFITRLLKFVFYCKTSAPQCFLLEEPGTIIKYDDKKMREILSPGVRKYGSIKNNSDVRVLFPGLYFSTDSNPIVKQYVTRMSLYQN
jgi:hypothetical protein